MRRMPEFLHCTVHCSRWDPNILTPTFYIHEDILFLIHYFYIGILELILIFIYDSYTTRT